MFLRDVGRPPGNAATQVTKAPKKRPQRPALRHADIARHPKAHSQHEEPDQGHPEPAIRTHSGYLLRAELADRAGLAAGAAVGSALVCSAWKMSWG